MKPELQAFSYTVNEQSIINQVTNQARPWEAEELKEIKVRIKQFHLNLTSDMCCYCYRDLKGEFSMVIDIEHILPKRHFRELTFEIKNLSVACKRCNMKMKRDDLDFLEHPLVSGDFEMAHKYKFIHPNFDDRKLHLKRIAVQNDDIRIVKYKVLNSSQKGDFSYKYFKLSEFETDSYDDAQGSNQPNVENISNIRNLVQTLMA